MGFKSDGNTHSLSDLPRQEGTRQDPDTRLSWGPDADGPDLFSMDLSALVLVGRLH